MNQATADSLSLRDIHLPAPPDFWPPAPGWWLLAAVVLALLTAIGIRLWRYVKIQRQRQHILDLLQQLEHASPSQQTPDYLARLSQLLRRLALTRFPARQIASLTGEDWLHFLDTTGGNGQFCHGPGRILADGPYVRTLHETLDSPALSSLVRQWIKKNTAG